MQTPDTRELADLVTEVIAEGPCSGYEIVRALEDRHHFPLRGWEGAIYVVLVQLEQQGAITGSLEEWPNGTRRRRYRLPVLEDLRRSSRKEENAVSPEDGG